MKVVKLKWLAALAAVAGSTSALAAPIYWTDWSGGDLDPSAGFKGQGTIQIGATNVTATYANPKGIAFYQSGPGTDFWASGSVANGTSPYTGPGVENRPTTSDIIALYQPGTQTVSFSQKVFNPVLSFVSMNNNTFTFDYDFDIVSYAGQGNNVCGWYGCGVSTKNVITVDGKTKYQLVGAGENHGTIMLKGVVDSFSWNSLNGEYWNGITVGVAGLAPSNDVPEPGSLALLGLGLAGVLAARRRLV